MFTAFKTAIIIASIMGKINLESIYTEYFIRQNKLKVLLSQPTRQIYPPPVTVLSSLAKPYPAQIQLFSYTIPASVLLNVAGGKKKHNHTGQVSLSVPGLLTPCGPLMLHSHHPLFLEFIHSHRLLVFISFFSPSTSNIASPSLLCELMTVHFLSLRYERQSEENL